MSDGKEGSVMSNSKHDELKLKVRKLIYAVHLFEKTNCRGSYVVAAYHHPDSITWRWSIWYSLPRKLFVLPKLQYDSTNGYGYLSLNVPIFGSISLNTQPSMWRDEIAGQV